MILKICPYEKNKIVYNDVIIADLTKFFNTNFNAIQNTIATDKIIKSGNIIPSKRIRCWFWEYINNTGNNAIKIGWNTNCVFKLNQYILIHLWTFKKIISYS
mgnify:CR=1 FL=1